MNRLPSSIRQYIAALRMLLVFTAICGIVYPVVMWGVAQAAFKNQADGSLVSLNGKVVGSSLLCQEFVDSKGNPLPQYFQERPSNATSGATTDYGCDPGYSAASNLGPNNSTLLTNVKQRQEQIAAFDHVAISQIPPDVLRFWARPGHLPAVRGHPGQAGRRRPAFAGRYGPGAGEQVHPGPQPRFPRRAAGRRAHAEHRTGRVAVISRGDDPPYPPGRVRWKARISDPRKTVTSKPRTRLPART